MCYSALFGCNWCSGSLHKHTTASYLSTGVSEGSPEVLWICLQRSYMVETFANWPVQRLRKHVASAYPDFLHLTLTARSSDASFTTLQQ